MTWTLVWWPWLARGPVPGRYLPRDQYIPSQPLHHHHHHPPPTPPPPPIHLSFNLFPTHTQFFRPFRTTQPVSSLCSQRPSTPNPLQASAFLSASQHPLHLPCDLPARDVVRGPAPPSNSLCPTPFRQLRLPDEIQDGQLDFNFRKIISFNISVARAILRTYVYFKSICYLSEI